MLLIPVANGLPNKQRRWMGGWVGGWVRNREAVKESCGAGRMERQLNRCLKRWGGVRGPGWGKRACRLRWALQCGAQGGVTGVMPDA